MSTLLGGFAFHAKETNTFRVELREHDTIEQVINGVKRDLVCSDLAVWKVWHLG